jgi:8-oxo-dGTP pyrophosphatase MutT (NUDIX family)
MTLDMTINSGVAGAPQPQKAGAPVWKARAYTGAGIILTRIDADGTWRVLCLRGRQSGVWSFSKGHPEVEDDGKPLRTAARETFEETGLVAGDDYKIIGSSVRYGKRPYWIGVLQPGAHERLRVARREHDVAGWFSLEEAKGLRGNTDVRAWVRKTIAADAPFHYAIKASSVKRPKQPMH